MDLKPRVHVVGAALLEGGRCWAARRAPHVADGGLWELPGGKVEPGESPEQALQRELLEELGIEVKVEELLGRGEAVKATRIIVLDVYVCRAPDPVVPAGLPLVDHDDLRLLAADELGSVGWAAADIPVLGALRRRLVDGPPDVMDAKKP